VTVRAGVLVLLALAAAGCGSPTYNTSNNAPSARCLNEPGRTENYSQDRPLFFFFCAQSP
jgi:hypothetical protein